VIHLHTLTNKNVYHFSFVFPFFYYCNIPSILLKGLAEKQRIQAIKKHKRIQFSNPTLTADSLEHSHFDSTDYSKNHLLFTETINPATGPCCEPDGLSGPQQGTQFL